MSQPLVAAQPGSVPEFLQGGGELGQRIREYDWSATALGPVDTWPQSLRTCIRIMLTSRQPIWIGWGKELIKFYNDPYKAIVGGKHPWALGQPASVVWKDIWQAIDPMLRQVMEKDEGTYVESQLLIMERNGYAEETYYTFSYTPIPGDDGKTEGMFCANTDDTDKIISERQLRTLTQLGKSLADCKTNKEIIQKTIDTLADNPYDFPFAVFRTVADQKAVYAQGTSLGAAAHILTKEIDLNAHAEISAIIRKAFYEKKPQVFDALVRKVGELPKGAWQVSPDKAIILPIVGTGSKEPYGLLVIGMNPYRLLDEKYLGFFSLIADQIATAFADVHVLEEERKRAEALAEIDRAKTTFFSNISHEFRTPLTLLLGPVEDAVNDPNTIPENRIRMEVAYRNALRMQRLVNTLLEFSRIEAGRVEGKFIKVDIGKLTQDFASTFRSAVEKAGMALVFHCDVVKDEVYVDVEMWEKIVLNLVSNAFKYSKEGTISVSVQQVDSQIQLVVSDTGVGIPEDHIDKVFDRFHRIENIQGRSQEGTGIGLAMVKELVRIHQGTISLTSTVGTGSTFTITIPSGKEHLPADKIIHDYAVSEPSNYADAFVLEAMKWLPQEQATAEVINDVSAHETKQLIVTEDGPKVLLADDNADMREYVYRLLSTQFEVITAVDGEDAFQKMLQYKPELLISDIMMPGLDGFGLLKKVRDHLETRNTPVIFLSARAGEEAKVEGLDAGADDYLVKPFSAKELIVRVSNHIRLNQVRRETEQQFYELFMQAPANINVFKGRDYRYELYHPFNKKIFGERDFTGMTLAEAIPELKGQGIFELLDRVYYHGETIHQNERHVQFKNDKGELEDHYFNFVYQPWYDLKGAIQGVLNFAIEVTDTVKARKEIEQSEKELNQLANAVPQLVWVADPKGEVTYYNDRVAEFSGAFKNENGKWQWEGLVHEEDLLLTAQAWNEAVQTGGVYQAEHRIQMKDGTYRWFLSRAFPYKDEEGNIIKWFGTATDIHVSKMQATILEEEVEKRTKELHASNISLMQSNNELQQFAHVASHDLKEPVRKIKTFTNRLLEDAESTFSENGKLFLKKVDAAANRMNMMIEGVLNYSMLSASQQKIEEVDLNETVSNIETDLELPIAERNAVIDCRLLPKIQGASVLLYQLFYNLLNNSLKFSRPDVPLVVQISSTCQTKDEEAFVRIIIEDNGIGFEQAFAEKIFETFLRLNSKDRYEGTGLGLSLCKRIVERHGGCIEAFGAPDEGARFVIELPVKQPKGNI